MKNLKSFRKAGALCFACVVVILFSLSAYLEASEIVLPESVSAKERELAAEAAATQEEGQDMQRMIGDEENAGTESNEQAVSGREAQTEQPGEDRETEEQTGNPGESENSDPQTEFSGENIKPEEQTESSGESAKPEEQTESSGESAKPEGQTEYSGESAKPEGQTEFSGESAKPEGQTELFGGNTDAGNLMGSDAAGAGSGDQTELSEESTDPVSQTERETEDAIYETEETVEEEQTEADDLTLEEVMEEAQKQNIDFLGLAPGESLTFYMPAEQGDGIMTIAAVTAVTVTRAAVPYKYSDYGYGNLETYKYTVSFNDITATAYCIQPTNSSPGSSRSYKITKLKGAKELAKVCYYGTKAAGNEGFFAEKHPKFSEGQRFIITHIAAAYANGSPDAFTGASGQAQTLALELYEYCLSQPDIPEVEMEFSDAKVKAYVDVSVDSSLQRTDNIVFKADPLQTITFDLPAGVKLHNVSAGTESEAGKKVTIGGGTVFYLSAPITQASDVGAVWSSTMKGGLKKDYSAYKITTNANEQDLALVFGDGIEEEKFIDFSVQWVEPTTVVIQKNDAETGKGLQGAVFGVFSDSACTQPILQMPATDAAGASTVTLAPAQETVYLQEIAAPAGYVSDPQIHTVNTGEAEHTVYYTISNKSVRGKLKLVKKDAQTGTPQGDAVLEGAVYGLYAREDVVHPDGSTGVMFRAGEQVATLVTDAAGTASVDNLYMGKYYVREISPSRGYLLDTAEYDVLFENTNAQEVVIEKECVSGETVIRQPFQIIKIAGNGKTDTDLLKGAGFSAYLESRLGKREDGSWDFTSAVPVALGRNGETEIFTDETGYAVSAPLPFGTYIVRETTVPAGFAPVADFEVRIVENSPEKPQVWRVLQDKEFEAKLKIIKRDDETQKNVLKENTEFKVFNTDTGKYVEQVTYYPKKVKHTSYFTDEEGSLTLPQNLPRGHYRIEEVSAPDGYTAGKNALEVTVDDNVAYRVDEDTGDVLIEAVAMNHPVKGQLRVVKKGQVLRKFDREFLYEEQLLSGAVYEVYAAEDIYTADGQKDENGERILEYAEGTLVGTVTTEEDGEGILDDLPLGKYRIVEKTAPDGYVLNSEEQYAEFVYVDQDTPVITERVEFVNELQKAMVTAVKKNATNGAVLSGAEFGLYAKEDMIRDKETIVEADTLLATAVTGEDGKAVFDLGLPPGAYYVRELQPPKGFLPTDKTVDLTFSYEGQETKTVPLEAVFENEPTTVKVTKADITTGAELDGAALSVLDKDGKVIDSWVSERGKPHFITGLSIGETYRLREELAPYGYLRAEEVKFTVSGSGEIQEVRMEDAVPVGRIIISKTGEFADSVTWGEMVSGTLEAVFGYVSGSLKEVVFEVHAAEDIKAADGVSGDYYKKDELVETITTDVLGYARADGLPLGRYYVVEKKTAEGFVLDGEPREIDLTYRDQDTPVVLYDEEWQNSRQKVTVSVLKKEKGTDQALAGGVFALCAGKDIVGASGKVLIKEDDVIEQKTTGKDGRLTFSADLPIGGQYYVREVKAPAGYVTTDKVKKFTFSYAGESTPQAVYDFTFHNRPTRVKVSKTDITSGAELPGARLQVKDENGNVVDSWVSGTKPHMIRKLEAGKTYTLREETAPEGYLVAEEVKFKVKNTGKIQTVVMKDAREPEVKPGGAPKTGDDTNFLYWAAVMAASVCALVFLRAVKRR